MRNLWARVKPEDVIQRDAGVAKGLSISSLGFEVQPNIVTARKRLSADEPKIVGDWNLKWLVYPDLDTYATDKACLDEDGNHLPRLYWERLFILCTIGADAMTYKKRPLWELAARSTPREFVDIFFDKPHNTRSWTMTYFPEVVWPDKAINSFDEEDVKIEFEAVGKSWVPSVECVESWVEEARARAYAWTPYAEAASQPSSGGNVIRVNFGRP